MRLAWSTYQVKGYIVRPCHKKRKKEGGRESDIIKCLNVIEFRAVTTVKLSMLQKITFYPRSNKQPGLN